MQVCDSKSYKSKEPLELVGSGPLQEASTVPGTQEAGQGKDTLEEETLEEQESMEGTQSKTGRTTKKGEMPVPGKRLMAAVALAPSFFALFPTLQQAVLDAKTFPVMHITRSWAGHDSPLCYSPLSHG